MMFLNIKESVNRKPPQKCKKKHDNHYFTEKSNKNSAVYRA